jgi:diadenosine tetraphosphate (Ap4A) HIT family hydrolase
MGVKDHFHLHLIPIWDESSMDISNAHSESEADMQAVQARIIENLS